MKLYLLHSHLPRLGQGEDPSDAGFITLTDQLGDYMQVDDINTLVYANQLYKYRDKTETTKDGKTVGDIYL